VRFADGGPARPWWDYTAERKRKHADVVAKPGAPRTRKKSRS